jgi:hypothetical protein
MTAASVAIAAAIAVATGAAGVAVATGAVAVAVTAAACRPVAAAAGAEPMNEIEAGPGKLPGARFWCGASQVDLRLA